MERKEDLDAIADSKMWMRSAVSAGERGDYNIGIYSLEMSVEIAIKAVLIHMDEIYPKKHDIAAFFINSVEKNTKKLPKDFIKEQEFIVTTFIGLLKMRGTAGYSFSSNMEITHLKDNFNKYLEASRKILALCEKAISKQKMF